MAIANTYTYQLQHFNADVEAFALRLSFSSLWEKNRFARIFFLNKQGELRRDNEAAYQAILVNANGLAAWSPAIAYGLYHLYHPWVFQWNEWLTNNEFLRLSSSEVWAHILHLLVDEESDAQFTRSFSLCSESERHALVFKNRRANEEEFKSVLRDLALSQGFWDRLPPNVQSSRLAIYSSSWGQLKLTFEDEFAIHTLESSPDFYQMVEKVFNWFQPINSEVAQRPAVQEWLLRDGTSFQITLSYPTAHERLEAYLRWQDWLAKTQGAEK